MTESLTPVTRPSFELRLLPRPPRPAVDIELDASQRAVVEAPTGINLCWGAPGTGKTSVVVRRALTFLNDPDAADGVLVLSPARVAAARVRDELSAHLSHSLNHNPVRTVSSYAFDVVRRAYAAGFMPQAQLAPRLITGAEQDRAIAEILSGHASGETPGPRWPEDLRLALGTRGFRHELRDLFDRANDLGLYEDDFYALARSADVPEWAAAGQLYAEYRDVLDLRYRGSFDSSALIRAAVDIFRENPEFLESEKKRLRTVIVDDAQELSGSAWDLLGEIVGGDALFCASPDTTVQGFRGARPDLLSSRVKGIASPREFVLSSSHRMNESVATAYSRVAERIPVTTRADFRNFTARPDRAELSAGQGPTTESVRAVVVDSAVAQWRFIAHDILKRHIFEQESFSQCAVIVRNGTLVAEAARALSAAGVPVESPEVDIPLGREPVVAALLDYLEGATEAPFLTGESARRLLLSPFGGFNPVLLRSLFQALRSAVASPEAGELTSDELLLQALQRPAELNLLGPAGRLASRTARMLAAGRDAAGKPGADVSEILWAIWEASERARRWRTEALSDGASAAQADRDLDAMMSLFQTAERYVDAAPGARPRDFLDFLRQQDVPMDSLAARGQAGERVEILTPAAAAGREFDHVYIGGLEEGVWPNTRIRGQLLRSDLLSDTVELGFEAAQQRSLADKVAATRHDELRTFAVACSRARFSLTCVASDEDDERPSSFIDIVDPLSGDNPRPMISVSRPQTLRMVVAEARQRGESWHQSEPQSPSKQLDPGDGAQAATLLSYLAEHSVPGAAPESWWGLLPLSTSAPLFRSDQDIRLGPSSLERITGSALTWFFDRASGDRAPESKQKLGTLIHAIAQSYPDLHLEDLSADLERSFPQLGLPSGWQREMTHTRAERMIAFLAEYGRVSRSAHRRFVGAEVPFAFRLPKAKRVVVRGSVDRLETDAEGRIVIADFKTSASAPASAAVSGHLQLGAYQLAALYGGFDSLMPFVEGTAQAQSGGALLINVGKDVQKLNTSVQKPIDLDDEPFSEAIVSAADAISGTEFLGKHDPSRSDARCPYPHLCPLCSGKQVTE